MARGKGRKWWGGEKMDGMKMGRRKEEEGGEDEESGRGRGMLGGREGMKKGKGRDGRTPKISKRGCA